MKTTCEGNHFLNKVAGFLPATLLKKPPFTVRGSKGLYLRAVFSSMPIFAEHHSTSTSKAKYETAVHNSAKCLPLYRKMKKCFSSFMALQSFIDFLLIFILSIVSPNLAEYLCKLLQPPDPYA